LTRLEVFRQQHIAPSAESVEVITSEFAKVTA
jgi:hypothetical protein